MSRQHKGIHFLLGSSILVFFLLLILVIMLMTNHHPDAEAKTEIEPQVTELKIVPFHVNEPTAMATPIPEGRLIVTGQNPTPTPTPTPPFWYNCFVSCIAGAVRDAVGTEAYNCITSVYSSSATWIGIIVCIGGVGANPLGSMGCLTAPAAYCGISAILAVEASGYACAFWCWWYS